MKIAFIGQKGIPGRGGGIEKYAEDLSVPMAKMGHEVLVYTRPYYTPKDLAEFKGVKLISLPTIKTKHLDAITHSILASIDVLRRDVDVVHYQNIGPALTCFIPKLFSKKIIVVSTLQSRDYEHKKWGWVARKMLMLGELFLCTFSDVIISVTDEIKEYIKKRYGKDSLLITNGVTINEKVPADKILDWGLHEKKYIVAITRLIRHKGIKYLIEAYKKLETEKKLVIVGEGSYTEDYVNEMKKLGNGDPRIIFTGNQNGEALAELYSNAYLFVQPSESEGLSLALLEAMSYKVPVLVSDIPGNLEAVGKAGIIFKNKDIDDLCEKLAFALNNPEALDRIGIEGYVRVVEHFHCEKISEQLLKAYSLASKKIQANKKK